MRSSQSSSIVSLPKSLVEFRRRSGERKSNHFLRRHVRRRKYFSACKRARRPPKQTARALQSGRKLLCQKSNTFLTVSRGGKPPRIKMWLSFILREAQIKDSPLLQHQNKGLSCGVRFHHLRTSFSFLAAHGYLAPHTDSDRCEGKCSFKISHHCVPSPELQNPVCFRSIQYIGLTSKASTEPLL